VAIISREKRGSHLRAHQVASFFLRSLSLPVSSRVRIHSRDKYLDLPESRLNRGIARFRAIPRDYASIRIAPKFPPRARHGAAIRSNLSQTDYPGVIKIEVTFLLINLMRVLCITLILVCVTKAVRAR